MARGNTPPNGPSKTGNPSGKGRGNNPPGWDDEDDTDNCVHPSTLHADSLTNGYYQDRDRERDLMEDQRDAARRVYLKDYLERSWFSTTIRDVKAAAVERLGLEFYQRAEMDKRLVLFIQTCRDRLGWQSALEIAEHMEVLRAIRSEKLVSKVEEDDPLLTRTQPHLELAEWLVYYDAQFKERGDEADCAGWEHCKRLIAAHA